MYLFTNYVQITFFGNFKSLGKIFRLQSIKKCKIHTYLKEITERCYFFMQIQYKVKMYLFTNYVQITFFGNFKSLGKIFRLQSIKKCKIHTYLKEITDRCNFFMQIQYKVNGRNECHNSAGTLHLFSQFLKTRKESRSIVTRNKKSFVSNNTW